VGGLATFVNVKVKKFELTILEGMTIVSDLLPFDVVKFAYSSTAMFDILTLVSKVSAFHKGK
jgi:hypothetical protein